MVKQYEIEWLAMLIQRAPLHPPEAAMANDILQRLRALIAQQEVEEKRGNEKAP